MHKFITLVHSTWSSGSEGDPADGFQFEYQYVRWEEVSDFFALILLKLNFSLS